MVSSVSGVCDSEGLYPLHTSQIRTGETHTRPPSDEIIQSCLSGFRLMIDPLYNVDINHCVL